MAATGHDHARGGANHTAAGLGQRYPSGVLFALGAPILPA